MRIVKRRHLADFWESRTHDAEIAEKRLRSWYDLAKPARWANFAELKQTFGSADAVGDCIVFDVGNNLFRLIGRVNYRNGKLYVLKIMDHKEYDKGRWIEECGCNKPRPKKKQYPRSEWGIPMATKTDVNVMPDSYFKLVRQFPLTSIRDNAHLDEAFAMIDRLLRMDLDEGQEAYLDALTDLVEVYEDANVIFPKSTEADLLRELMDSNRLSQTQLAKEVKISQSTLSAVLNGSRSLTKEQMAKLGRRFNLPASVFLPG